MRPAEGAQFDREKEQRSAGGRRSTPEHAGGEGVEGDRTAIPFD